MFIYLIQSRFDSLDLPLCGYQILFKLDHKSHVVIDLIPTHEAARE